MSTAGPARRFAGTYWRAENTSVRSLATRDSVAAARFWYLRSATVERCSKKYLVNVVVTENHHSITGS